MNSIDVLVETRPRGLMESLGENMRRLRMALAVALAAIMVGSGFSVAFANTAELSLMRPTGPLAVGKSTVRFEDSQRADPWVASKRRELMVSLWYPAVPLGRPAAYMTLKESAVLVQRFSPDLPPGLLTTIRTHARVNALPLPRVGGFPLVVLSPGWSMNASSQTGLAEDLASRGHVVAAIDHTYETYATEFPDGHVTECAACTIVDGLSSEDAGRFFEKVTAERALDVSLVLDELIGTRWIDSRRIGIAGHSIGGASTLSTMLRDRRVKAGVDWTAVSPRYGSRASDCGEWVKL